MQNLCFSCLVVGKILSNILKVGILQPSYQFETELYEKRGRVQDSYFTGFDHRSDE